MYCFIFLIHILKSLVLLAKFMPIANVNRIVFVNNQYANLALLASILRFGINSFIIHINLADFYSGGTSPIGKG